MMSDIWIKRMMTFIIICCVLVTALICFGACAGICEELNQTQTGPTDSWRDHHFEIHQQDMAKMDRVIDLLRQIEERLN